MKSEFCPNLSSQAPFWRMGLLVDHNLGPKNGARNAAKSDSPERSISVGAVINSPGLFFCFYFFSCYMVAIWLLYGCYMFAICSLFNNHQRRWCAFLGCQILTGFGAFDDHQGSQGKGSWTVRHPRDQAWFTGVTMFGHPWIHMW